MASFTALNQYSGSETAKMIDSQCDSRAEVANRGGEKCVMHRGKTGSQSVKEKMLNRCFLW